LFARDPFIPDRLKVVAFLTEHRCYICSCVFKVVSSGKRSFLLFVNI